MPKPDIHRERGTSLIETLFATAICMIAVFALAGLVSMSTRQSKDMGWTVAQATGLAGQKLDQLMGLQDFADALLRTDCSPPICGDLTSNFSNAGQDWFEFLDENGLVMAGANANTAGVFFTRRWMVESPSATLKRITIRVEGRSVGRRLATTATTSFAPSATLACLKASRQ